MWLHMYSDGTSKIGTLYECMCINLCSTCMYLETEVVINSVDEGKHEARGPTRTPVVEVVFESTYNPLLLKRLCPTQRRHWSQLLQHICERLHYICETVELQLQLLNHQELTSLRDNIY
jgi:hypothetical protein